MIDLKKRFYELVKVMETYHNLVVYKQEELKKDPTQASQFGDLSYFPKGVIGRINEYPEILTIQDEFGYNLGMHAALNEIEEVVLRALDDKDASTQQNKYGDNIGMVAATFGLEKATIKALENTIASFQKNNEGETILDIVKRTKMDIDTKQSKKAITSQDKTEQDEMDKTISNIYDEILGM